MLCCRRSIDCLYQSWEHPYFPRACAFWQQAQLEIGSMTIVSEAGVAMSAEG